MRPGARTLAMAVLAVLSGTVVTLAHGDGLTPELLELLLGAPIVVGGRHLVAELAPLLQGLRGPVSSPLAKRSDPPPAIDP